MTNIAVFNKDGKVDVDNEGGGQVQASPCKVIAAGPSTVWCLDLDNHCQVLTNMERNDLHCFETQVRTDVSVNCPAGKNWVSVDGEYKAITVSGKVDNAIFFLVVLIFK